MLIDDQNNIIVKSQFLGLILSSMVAPGTTTLSLQVSERELYGRFIYLSIYPYIVNKGRQEINT